MNYLEEKVAIETFFKTNWTYTPIVYENGQANNDTNEWVRISIVNGNARQVNLGDNPSFRVTSVVYIQINTRKDVGSGRAIKLADIADSMFKNLDLDGLRFKVPQVTRNPNPGEWFQVNVSTEFYRGI